MCGHVILEVSKPIDAKQVKLLCSGVTYFYIGAEEFKIDHAQDEKQLWIKSEKSTAYENRETKSNNDKQNNGEGAKAQNSENLQLNKTEETLIINENAQLHPRTSRLEDTNFLSVLNFQRLVRYQYQTSHLDCSLTSVSTTDSRLLSRGKLIDVGDLDC